MNKACKTLTALTIVFGSAMVIFLCLFLSFLTSSNNYKTQLENNYMKSFYEMVDNINSLEVDLSKIVATNNISSQRELLSGIYETCMIGVTNVNNLPISNEKLTEINSLLNTAGGFSYSLLLNNYKGELITETDYKQIEDIYDSVISLRYDINQYVSRLNYDYNILDEIDFKDGSGSEFSAGIIGSESASKETPTLIYDGPFSDSVVNKEIKGLEDRVCSIEEAKQYLSGVFVDKDIEYIGDTSGKFETYNFKVYGSVELYVSVTKKGCMLLDINALGNGQGKAISIEDGIALAEGFANSLGFDNMYCVWQQQTGSILYVNLAPIINRVIYYPDLIKVKVDLALSSVVGWEAVNYATNHIDRSFSSSLGILDALENINPLMTVIERNLCIIPDKFVGELSAYEFICTWEKYTYYIYIDANTGEEVNILRVVDTSNGQLLI